jgi:hypothetical protein
MHSQAILNASNLTYELANTQSLFKILAFSLMKGLVLA